MTTVNSLTVFLLIGNLQIEITADFWENLGIQYWSIESDYCVQHSLSERAIYSNPRCSSGILYMYMYSYRTMHSCIEGPPVLLYS